MDAKMMINRVMKVLFVIIGIVILLPFIGWVIIEMKRPILRCQCKEELIGTIKQMFDADSVYFHVSYSPKIPYQPEIKGICLTIVNGTTNTLDFKTHTRASREDKIEDALKKEADMVARLVFERCNSEKFNTIVVYFSKYLYYDDKNKSILTPIYQYWYHEELFPEKWEGIDL